MIDNSLTMGILLIGVGLALALIAYAVLLNRREDGQAEPPEPADEETGPGEPLMEEPTPATPPMPIPAPEIPAPPVPSPRPPAAPATPPGPGLGERRLLPVVTLLREEVTGEVAVQVGERIYRRVEELSASPDMSRVQSVAAELGRWMARSPAPAKAAGAARDEAPAKHGSMIDQINQILEEREDSGTGPRGIRLAEGPGGTVRVLVGVQSFAMDEVPDPQVRELIRQAVAEWEGRG